MLPVACVLLVAAASDLAPLEKDLAQAVPGCQVRFSFASSGTLARQIAAGASFDLFLSASRSYTDQLHRDGHASASVPFAQGRLALFSTRGIKWAQLAEARSIAIANPAFAPYGKAAQEALENQGLWNKLRARLVFGENVRQAFQFAATGNADVTLTSWSLARDKGGEILPASWHQPIIQTASIPKRANNPAAGRRLVGFLQSAQGRALLSAHGFETAK